jgi:hypothetical protein
MYWTAGEFVLLGTAALFGVVLLLGLLPAVRLWLVSRVVFAVAGVLCAGAALILASFDHVNYPALMWTVPLIPVTVIVVMVRDAARTTGVLVDEPALVAVATAEPEPEAQTPTQATVAQADVVVHRIRRPVPFTERRRTNLAEDAVARARAHNPYTDPTDLAELAYGYPMLRAVIAANPATPATVLDWLAETGDPVVIAAISARGTSVLIRGRIA